MKTRRMKNRIEISKKQEPKSSIIDVDEESFISDYLPEMDLFDEDENLCFTEEKPRLDTINEEDEEDHELWRTEDEDEELWSTEEDDDVYEESGPVDTSMKERIDKLSKSGPSGASKNMSFKSEMDSGFTPDEIKTLLCYELPPPSQISKKKIKWYINKVDNQLVDLGRKKGSLSTTDNSKQMYKNRTNELKNRIVLLRIYKNRLKPKPENDKKVYGGRYTQEKRNAYKISPEGKYGTLTIHLPTLHKDSIIVAYKNGEKVYEKGVDADTIDLLTKRFNSNKEYSILSRGVFNELNKLGELPIHRTSKKYSKIGSGVIHFNNTEDLLLQMEVLIDVINNGDDTKDAKNELIKILRKMVNEKLINADTLMNIIEEFLI